MNPRHSIFLSASIPFGSRLLQYPADPFAIQEAVRALVRVFSTDFSLVFGGHPAITPFVKGEAEEMGTLGNIHIFQSRFYEEKLTEDARKLMKEIDGFHWSERTGDAAESIATMRRNMIETPEDYGIPPYAASFYIGGMNGVFDELEIFKTRYPELDVYPLASTSGAAGQLADRWKSPLEPAFSYDKRYSYLFRRIKEGLLEKTQKHPIAIASLCR